MPAHQAGSPRVSSTVTKHNPRPRKYASASERQAAYRARAPEVCFRAEAKTVETLDAIAETLDQPRADLLLSMTKFALANHDWARFGMTHKPLPYGYGLAEQEFIGPRQANPQPIWKRARPKSLGKPVPLTPKQKAAAKKRAAAAGRPYPNLVDNIAAARLENPTVNANKWKHNKLRGTYTRAGYTIYKYGQSLNKGWYLEGPDGQMIAALDYLTEAKRIGDEAIEASKTRKDNPMKKPTPAQLAARARFAEMARSGAFKKKAATKRKVNPAGMTWLVHLVGKPESWYATRASKASATRLANQLNRQAGDIKYEVSEASWSRKANPAKKTVSQKISQLMHEGYPQKQAVAVALSEQRAGKVKANPARRGRAPSIQVGDYVRSYDFPGMHDDHYLEGVVTAIGNGMYSIAVSRRVVGGEEKSIPASLRQVRAPMEPHFMTGVYGVQKLTRKTNPATGQKKSRTKLNPVQYRDIAKDVPPARVQYAVHLADRPSYHAMSYFTKKSDALEVAQEVADRTGKQIAVSRVQVHFGPM